MYYIKFNWQNGNKKTGEFTGKIISSSVKDLTFVTTAEAIMKAEATMEAANEGFICGMYCIGYEIIEC